MHVARGVAPGLWGSHASGGSEIESILQNRQSTVLPFVMHHQPSRPVHHPTTAIEGHQQHPPLPSPIGPKSPGTAHGHATTIANHTRAMTNQWLQRRTTTTSVIGRHQGHPPLSTIHWAQRPWHCAQAHGANRPVTAANCPARACTRCTCRCTTIIPYQSGTPPTSPTSSPCRAQGPQHCVQVRGTGAVPARQYNPHRP